MIGALMPCLWAHASRLLNDSLVTRPFRHQVWQEVLTQNVNSQGEVDFARIRAHPKRLNQYLAQLEAISPDSDPTAFSSANDKTAYWINAHNALALRIILDHYPTQSLAAITDFETDTHYKLGSKPYCLREIRQKLAVTAKRDARLLFTLTDYSFAAPAILPQAYEGNRLKTLEGEAAKMALQNGNVIQTKTHAHSCAELRLSPFFKSYQQSLFARTVAETEDQDSFSEASGMVLVAFSPASNTSWANFLRPLLPSDVYAGLGSACHQSVGFLPANLTLRQARP